MQNKFYKKTYFCQKLSRISEDYYFSKTVGKLNYFFFNFLRLMDGK